MAICVVCGRELQPKAVGRRPLYCSGACRQHAYRHRLEERVWRGGTLGVVETAEDIRRFAIQRRMEMTDGVTELAEVMVATETPVVWKNPYRGRGFVNDDDVARADILIGMFRTVVENQPIPYGAKGGRADQDILVALRESVRIGSAWVGLPLTSHQQMILSCSWSEEADVKTRRRSMMKFRSRERDAGRPA